MVSRSKEQGGSDHARCSCRSKGVGCDWFVGDAARRRRLEVKAVRAYVKSEWAGGALYAAYVKSE